MHEPDTGVAAFRTVGRDSGPVERWSHSVGSVALIDADDQKVSILQMINRGRSAAGLDAVSTDPRLEWIATAHSKDMARHGMLEHAGSDGSSHDECLVKAGFSRASSYQAAENIGYSSSGVAAVMKMWASSPSHQRNFLRPEHERVGTGGTGANWTVILSPPEL